MIILTVTTSYVFTITDDFWAGSRTPACRYKAMVQTTVPSERENIRMPFLSLYGFTLLPSALSFQVVAAPLHILLLTRNSFMFYVGVSQFLPYI